MLSSTVSAFMFSEGEAVSVTESDLINVLTNLGFQETSFVLHSIPAEVMDEEPKGYTGYKGLIFLRAKK